MPVLAALGTLRAALSLVGPKHTRSGKQRRAHLAFPQLHRSVALLRYFFFMSGLNDTWATRIISVETNIALTLMDRVLNEVGAFVGSCPLNLGTLPRCAPFAMAVTRGPIRA